VTQYRKKPVVIDAWRIGVAGSPPPAWVMSGVSDFIVRSGGIGTTGLYIDTLEGTMHAEPGDWVIRGVKGELYPCKDDIFQLTYEPVDNAGTEQENGNG
jgi:hypothetical protein